MQSFFVPLEAILNAGAVNPTMIILGQIIYYGLWLYTGLILIRVLLTWISPNPYSPLMRFLASVCDPVLNRARRFFPLTLGGLDFSPMLAVMVLYLVGAVAGQWLVSMGRGLPAAVIAPIAAMALLGFLNSIAWLLMIIMGLRFIMALVQPSPYNMLVRIIYGLTEPLLAPLRRFFPPLGRGLDLRPLVFLLVVLLIQRVILYSLAQGIAAWIGGMAGVN